MLLATVICDCKSNDDDDDDDGGGGCDHCGVGCLEIGWIPELTQYTVQDQQNLQREI